MSDLVYYYMKLRTGDNLICCAEKELDVDAVFLDIMHPVQLITHQVPFQGRIMESMVMQPWVPFTESAMITLPTDSVLLIGEVKEPFLKQYKSFITKIQVQDSASVVESSGDESLDALKDFVTQLLQTPPDRIEDIEYDDDEEDEEDEDTSEQSTPQTIIPKKWLH